MAHMRQEFGLSAAGPFGFFEALGEFFLDPLSFRDVFRNTEQEFRRTEFVAYRDLSCI